MCYRCFRVLLLVLGIAMVVAGGLPIFAMMQVPEAWETPLIAAKLIFLPVGAICLMGAAGLQARYRRR